MHYIIINGFVSFTETGRRRRGEGALCPPPPKKKKKKWKPEIRAKSGRRNNETTEKIGQIHWKRKENYLHF